MAGRDVIVVGGSAGALPALEVIVRDLPGDLPASLFVALHGSLSTPGYIAPILSREADLIVSYARDDTPIELGHIYVAPPDYHLLLRPGRMRVVRGPRENGFRPAVDPLFRTAARSYGNRVVAVLLSGGLDDGTHGVMYVNECGGTAIVQDPAEAPVPSMPKSAIENAHVDCVLRAGKIAAEIIRLANSCVEPSEVPCPHVEPDVAEGFTDALRAQQLSAAPLPLNCPECGGALWETRDGNVLQYRCHVGHGYTAQTLLNAHADRVEQALWAAVRILEENAALQRRMADRMRERGLKISTERFEAQAAEREEHANTLRAILTGEPRLPDEESGSEAAESFRDEYQKKG
jgi:two-component system, chemotaxis family, protein-glutamate methylesterase/glutaminase